MLAKLLAERDPIPKAKLIDVVLEARSVTNVDWDPLIPLYTESLRQLGMIKAPDILNSLLKHSTITEHEQSHASKKTPVEQTTKASTFLTDFRIIQNIMMAVTSGLTPKKLGEGRSMLASVADWIFALLSWNSANADDENPIGGLAGSPDAVSVFEAIGILLAALVGSENALDSFSMSSAEGIYLQ